jgi:hypothetical protein
MQLTAALSSTRRGCSDKKWGRRSADVALLQSSTESVVPHVNIAHLACYLLSLTEDNIS